jgi:hypothetical protein
VFKIRAIETRLDNPLNPRRFSLADMTVILTIATGSSSCRSKNEQAFTSAWIGANENPERGGE